MSQLSPPAHTPWINRFETPTLDDLLSQYEGHARTLAGAALDALTELVEAKPVIEWKGLPWRWTCVFKPAGAQEPSVYLVPTPDWPSIALPVPVHVAQEHLAAKGSKYIKETLTHACQVGQIRWAEWSIQGKAQLADVLALSETVVSAQPA